MSYSDMRTELCARRVVAYCPDPRHIFEGPCYARDYDYDHDYDYDYDYD